MRRPPERVERRLALAAAARGVGAHVQRLPSRQKLASKHRLERLGRGSGAEAVGDLGSRRVGVLGREPALLDREGGAVAGGVDVLEPAHAAALVDRDEPGAVGGEAVDRGSVHHRQGDHLGPPQGVAPRGDDQLAVCLVHQGLALELHPAHRQHLANRVARGWPEDRQRALLGGEEADRELLVGALSARRSVISATS